MCSKKKGIYILFFNKKQIIYSVLYKFIISLNKKSYKKGGGNFQQKVEEATVCDLSWM